MIVTAGALAKLIHYISVAPFETNTMIRLNVTSAVPCRGAEPRENAARENQTDGAEAGDVRGRVVPAKRGAAVPLPRQGTEPL